jgi:hypothetical protein
MRPDYPRVETPPHHMTMMDPDLDQCVVKGQPWLATLLPSQIWQRRNVARANSSLNISQHMNAEWKVMPPLPRFEIVWAGAQHSQSPIEGRGQGGDGLQSGTRQLRWLFNFAHF